MSLEQYGSFLHFKSTCGSNAFILFLLFLLNVIEICHFCFKAGKACSWSIFSHFTFPTKFSKISLHLLCYFKVRLKKNRKKKSMWLIVLPYSLLVRHTIYSSVMLPSKYAWYLSQLHNKYHKLNELLTPEIHSSLLWRLEIWDQRAVSQLRSGEHPLVSCRQLTSHCVLRREPS